MNFVLRKPSRASVPPSDPWPDSLVPPNGVSGNPSPKLLIEIMPVCTENLSSDVVVVKSAKDRMRFNASGRLNWARDRRVFIQWPDAFWCRCNSMRTIAVSGADAPHPRQWRGPHTRAGSIRSSVQRSHFAKVKLVQRACPGCPWRAIGVLRWCQRCDPDLGSCSAEPHSREMPRLVDVQPILPSDLLWRWSRRGLCGRAERWRRHKAGRNR